MPIPFKILTAAFSRIMDHVIKHKSPQTGFVNMTMSFLYSDDLHSNQISIWHVNKGSYWCSIWMVQWVRAGVSSVKWNVFKCCLNLALQIYYLQKHDWFYIDLVGLCVCLCACVMENCETPTVILTAVSLGFKCSGKCLFCQQCSRAPNEGWV